MLKSRIKSRNDLYQRHTDEMKPIIWQTEISLVIWNVKIPIRTNAAKTFLIRVSRWISSLRVQPEVRTVMVPTAATQTVSFPFSSLIWCVSTLLGLHLTSFCFNKTYFWWCVCSSILTSFFFDITNLSSTMNALVGFFIDKTDLSFKHNHTVIKSNFQLKFHS